MTDNDNKHTLFFNDKEIILLGTAHVSRESAELVHDVILEEKPDTVCIELCEARYQSLTQKTKWQDTDLIKVIKEKKAFLLLSNLMLASFQKKIAGKLGIKPGEDMMSAIRTAEETGSEIYLADRNIRTTLSRIWRMIGLWAKIKLLAGLITSIGEVDEIGEEDIEKLKEKDVLEALLSEMEDKLPELRGILIDERDQYLSHKIKTAPGKKIVAVVGAGHVPGIKKYWEKDINTEMLDKIPPKGRISGFLKWGIPAAIIGLIIAGFLGAGSSAGTDMIKWWVLANAVLAGLGAAIALGHPLTVLSAVVASPLTSLNPVIAAGWVSGLSELVLRKPKVKDFENLPEDISSFKGFWRNKITRILLVVVLTNMGSSLGTFVAIPLMAKVIA